jgi:hypothetical protein
MNLSFSERRKKEGARQVFLDGQLLRGASAQIYEASKMGDHPIPKFTGVTFCGKSVDAIRSFAVSDLFTHLDQFNLRVRIRNAIAKAGSWGFGDLMIGPDLVKKTDNCSIFVRIDTNPDKWDRPYSIRDLAECIHLGLNETDGEYVFHADTPHSLVMGFGLFTSFPLDAKIGEVLAKIVPDLETVTNYARGILESKNAEKPLLRISMQSTFISYGGPDEDFARKVFDSLKKMGVVVFFFPETARLGERIDAEVFRRIQEHDRVLLICSEESLNRPGVTHEIRETLDREARDGGATYLLPITLDDYVFNGFREQHSDLAERLSRRIIGDFRGTKRSRTDFDKAMHRVADALTKK